MKPASIWDWLGPFILMAVFITYLYLSSDSSLILCGGEQLCFREWLGALSGWVAALGAGWAAFKTIQPMRQQVTEAKRQTDFQLGDAEPTIDAVQHQKAPRRAVVRVRNWNRRSMIIRRVSLGAPYAKLGVIFVRFENDEDFDLKGFLTNASYERVFDPAVTLEGWVARETAPPMLKFSISGFLLTDPKGKLAIEKNDNIPWRDTPITIEFELVGLRGRFEQTTHVHMTSAATDIDDDVPDALDDLDPKIEWPAHGGGL